MRIKLTDHYSGVPSNFRPIFPGEYEATDERLFGLADYLVRTGHAVVTEDAPVAAWISDETAAELPDAEVEIVEDKPGIEDMSLAELKEEATKRGLSFGSRVTKAELIALIEGEGAE